MDAEPEIAIKRRHLIFRHWQGQARLWQSYWLMGVVGGWLFWTLVLNLIEFGILPEIPGVIILASYAVYSAVGVWRCAFNADWRGWGYLARGIIGLSTIYLLYQLFQST
ncbi:MAG: hypothetical protein QF605_00040 [Rhodospirillales bacterium]|jgi:hypothetical protein|nr:hypothetical protein [Rhodospirillales bacterium]